MSLLEEIRTGKQLRKVPDSEKNDRSTLNAANKAKVAPQSGFSAPSDSSANRAPAPPNVAAQLGNLFANGVPRLRGRTVDPVGGQQAAVKPPPPSSPTSPARLMAPPPPPAGVPNYSSRTAPPPPPPGPPPIHSPFRLPSPKPVSDCMGYGVVTRHRVVLYGLLDLHTSTHPHTCSVILEGSHELTTLHNSYFMVHPAECCRALSSCVANIRRAATIGAGELSSHLFLFNFTPDYLCSVAHVHMHTLDLSGFSHRGVFVLTFVIRSSCFSLHFLVFVWGWPR
ncbi:hypothetical protein CRM22_005415 [Opisthorchis felineus]|uniref:WH2 domain-containing protein n=1 Tax=Opisthorchis felineus TaxID=147828 RepID=A0A4S2LYD1_OPIFE|nr:hypothetical protein CRM22_005415 [Opisthorchis felineus]